MEKNIKNEVMSQIKSGKLGIKARWVYAAKKIGLKSGLALTLIILTFILNIFFFYVKANNLLPSLHDGSSTWQEILHNLPYDLMIIILVLILILNYVIKKFEFSYKKPFAIIFSVFIALVILMATMLFVSNFNDMIRNGLAKSEYSIPYFSHFYMERCPMHGNR